MKPVITGFFKPKVAIVLLLCILFMTVGITHAADSSKKISPAKKAPVMKVKQTPKAVIKSIKPDLTVSKVELSKDCKVKFTIKNYSKGKIVNQLYNKGSVKVRVTGKPSKNYNIPFRQLDMRGLLKNAGGQVTYVTAIKLSKTTHVKVDVDPLNLIPESNETNNSSGRVQLRPKCIVQTVKPITRVVFKPDLIVDSFTKSPEHPNVTDEIAFTVRVRNKGRATSNACKLEIKVGGEGSPPKFDIPAMAPGATYSIRRHETLPIALTYLSIATIDKDNQVLEENEANNETQLIFRVSPAPRADLVVDSFTKSPEHPNVTDEIAFTVRVRNQGPAVSNACKLEIKVGGEGSPPKFDIPAMAPGATYSIRRHETLPIALTYLSIATIDKDNQVLEENEANNETQLIFRVSPAPRADLVVDSFTKSPEHPNVTDEIAFTVRVRNQGPAVSNACKLEIKVGGEGSPPKFDIPAMAPGATYSIRRHETLPIALTYLSIATIDKDNQVLEENEANNETQLIFRVSPAPRADLVVDSFTKSPEHPNVTDEIAFTVRVRNQGPAVSNACKLEIKVGGEGSPPKFDIPAMAPGATYSIRRHETLPIALTYLSIATIDKDNQVLEENEANNVTELIFRVNPPPRPDLTILSFKKIAGVSKAKNSTRFEVVVKNIGAADSLACKLSLKIGGESKIPLYSVPVIAPNATYTVTRSVKLARALRYRGVAKIDVDNNNIESSETNNEKILNF